MIAANALAAECCGHLHGVRAASGLSTISPAFMAALPAGDGIAAASLPFGRFLKTLPDDLPRIRRLIDAPFTTPTGSPRTAGRSGTAFGQQDVVSRLEAQPLAARSNQTERPGPAV